MSVAVWPTELPKPLRSGYQNRREETRQARLAAGPVGYRRRFSSPAEVVLLAIEVTLNQRALFWTFYDISTAGGTLPFRLPDPISDNQPIVDDMDRAILDENDQPILLGAEWLCLFGQELPSETMEAGRYLVSFSVVRLP